MRGTGSLVREATFRRLKVRRELGTFTREERRAYIKALEELERDAERIRSYR